MSAEEEVAFLRLLFLQWGSSDDTITADTRILCRLVAREFVTPDVIQRVLDIRFVRVGDRWQNEKCRDMKNKTRADVKNGRIGGIKSAEARARKAAPYPEATTPTGRPDPPPQAAPPALCTACGMNLYGKMDGTGEAYSKCQNAACAQKGLWLYADGHTWNPTTKESGNVVEGKVVLPKKKIKW